MLTPTDIHILVGLLTRVTSPDSVEIILGDLVYDAKADEKRDVDVTVTYKGKNNLITAFQGIEVKKHTRPLDVSHIEQLCIKLNDMPNISHKAIVSASGYTKPACKKADAHGVNLYSLIPWSNTIEGFEHFQFAPNFVMQQRRLSWASPRSILFQLETQHTNQSIEINKDTSICSDAGDELGLKTIQQLSDRLSLSALNQLVKSEEIKAISHEVEKEIQILFNNLENICIEIEGSKIRLKQALVKGLIVWKEDKYTPEFKILIKEGELKPYIGVALMEMQKGDLMGFTVSQVNRNLNLINIQVSDRNRKKIHKLRLK